MDKSERRERNETILLALGCVVVGAWVIVVLVQAAFPSHVVPTEVHGICFLVATALFGTAYKVGRKNGGPDAGGE